MSKELHNYILIALGIGGIVASIVTSNLIAALYAAAFAMSRIQISTYIKE